MHEHSLINHVNRLKQHNDFTGLTFHRGISPTDIDGIMDFRGNALIILEGKHVRAPENRAQEALLKCIVDTFNLAGKKATCIWYKHDTKTEDLIRVGSCFVTKVYYQKQETYISTKIQVYTAVKRALEKWEKEGVNI